MNLARLRRRGQDIDNFQRGQIDALHNLANWGYKRISTALHLSKSTVASYCMRSRRYGTKKSSRKNCKRPKITVAIEDRAIVEACKSHPFKSAPDIKNQLNLENVSNTTVRRRLVKAGLPAYRPARKPFLTQANVQRRLQWAILHSEWGYEENWSKVIYADESSFNLSKCVTQYVRRPRGARFMEKYIMPYENRNKAHINVWGALSASGFTDLIRIDGRCNAHGYINILRENLLPVYHVLLPDGGLFLHDNCPIHSARVTREWLQEHNVALLNHPAVSPDLNAIENVWAELGKIVNKNKHLITNCNALFELLRENWLSLMREYHYRQNLIRSIPLRVQDVIKSNGSFTRW